MSASKTNSCRIVISLIYIVMGIDSLIPSIESALRSALELDIIGILTASVGILMLLAGLFGILDVKRGVCRTMGIIIFAVSAFMFVWSLLKGQGYQRDGLIGAALAWLFIICI
ncbi:MAG: hypothetical protein PUA74_06745 [Clostridiales bacterium]|nr:hypothetical protein [Clostridiales bacterium]